MTAANVTTSTTTARTSSTTRADAEQQGAREEPQVSAGIGRWAVDQPANWSTAQLRSLIEESYYISSTPDWYSEAVQVLRYLTGFLRRFAG